MASSTTDPKKIQREDSASPAGGRERRALLEQAKARTAAQSRPGDMQGTPRFDEVVEAGRGMRPAPGASTPPPTLSKGTSDALAAVVEANRNRPAPAAAEETDTPKEPAAEFTTDTLAETLRCDARTARRVFEVLYPEKEPGSAVAMRRAIEKRLGALDIGEFLMNGVLSQRVTIIPPSEMLKSGLEVTFQTVTDGVEAHIDRLLSDEVARIRHVRLAEGSDKVVDAEMNQREYVRRQNEYAFAVHIRNYAGAQWPSVTKANGEVDETAVQKRLSMVRQVPSPLFALVINNLGWFLERVQETLDVAVLGNG